MSNSVMRGEEASWAPTFITVTSHEDGFLREIEENVVFSDPGDTPFNLDTWNVVLRRPVVRTTKDWIDSSELEQSERVETECQTYLQGVPKIELPVVYRDEATQTLYMGRDGMGIGTPMEYFDDIITVLNEKSLPEQKTSHVSQTTITIQDIASENDVVTMLIKDSDIIANDSQSSIEKTDKESALMEATDIVNFVVERTLWMSKAPSKSKREKKDVRSQTSLMYNHKTKKVTIDSKLQRELTCKPKYSNSMLLADYNETKNFCRQRVNECVENDVYPEIVIDNIVEEIITKCKRQMNFFSKEGVAIAAEKSAGNVEKIPSFIKNVTSTGKHHEHPREIVWPYEEAKTPNLECTGGSRTESWRSAGDVDRMTRSISVVHGLAASSKKNQRCSERRCKVTSSRSVSTAESTDRTSSSGDDLDRRVWTQNVYEFMNPYAQRLKKKTEINKIKESACF